LLEAPRALLPAVDPRDAWMTARRAPTKVTPLLGPYLSNLYLAIRCLTGHACRPGHPSYLAPI
jgi:hypothetical protein